MGNFFLHNTGVHSGACFLPPGVTAPFGCLVDFPLPQFGGLRGCIHRSCVPKLEPRARWLDLGVSRILEPCPIWKKQASTLTGVPILIWIRRCVFYMFLFVILADLKGDIFEMLQIQHVFLPSSSSSAENCRLLVWVLGERREALRHFSVSLFGRWTFVACQTCGSNASAVLHDPPVAIKPECIALVCHSSWVLCSWRVGSKIFFLALFFSLEVRVWWCWEISFFLWKKKGYTPGRLIFHE